jgi:hypothetical protein
MVRFELADELLEYAMDSLRGMELWGYWVAARLSAGLACKQHCFGDVNIKAFGSRVVAGVLECFGALGGVYGVEKFLQFSNISFNLSWSA